MAVESVKGRGRGTLRKMWRQCVDEDMTKLNLSVMDKQSSCSMEERHSGKPSNPCCSAENDVKR